MEIVHCNPKSKLEDNYGSVNREICRRHILVFGEEMQERISGLTIGVGSAGGLGMDLVDSLMRYFPGKLIIVDFDCVELTNLNRLRGATKLDARLKMKKSMLAERLVLTFNPGQEVESVEGNFLDRDIQLKFRECDVFFSCFDRISARLAANQLCLVHGITLYDLGTGIIVGNGRMSHAGGQVLKIVPGCSYCLCCLKDYYNNSEAAVDFMDSAELGRQVNMGYVRGANVAAPQVNVLNATVASLAVWFFVRELAGEKLDFDGVAFDAINFAVWPWKIEKESRNKSCPVCSESGIAMSGDSGELLTRNAAGSDSAAIAEAIRLSGKSENAERGD